MWEELPTGNERVEISVGGKEIQMMYMSCIKRVDVGVVGEIGGLDGRIKMGF